MFRFLSPVLFTAATLLAQYKLEPAGAPPSELDAAIAGSLQKEGVRLAGAGGPIAEFWFRTTLPSGPKASEESVTLPAVPHGSLLGVMKVNVTWADRRGQNVKPGLYTLRFSYFPQDGAHQGAAPQRDFLIPCLASEDKNLNSTPNFEDLMNWSRKASGLAHPLVFSIWKEDPGSFKSGSLEKSGEHDWVYQFKIGDEPISLIVIGKAEG